MNDHDDLDRRLRMIEARFEISELRSKYCWYTVRGERDGVLALFTEDGIFQNARNEKEAPAKVQGTQALADYFSRIKPARRVPLVTNEVTVINDNLAEGTCAMLGVGDDGFAGHYVDQFRCVDGVWLFSSRCFYPYWPIYKPATDRPHP
jgi:hypothetical protein